MSWGMQHIGAERARLDRVSAANTLVDFDLAGSGHADPGSLHVQHFEQSKVILVEQNRGAGGGAQLHRSAHVIDVSVSDDDLLDFEIMLSADSENVVDVVAGIDHHGFARDFISDNGTVAL